MDDKLPEREGWAAGERSKERWYAMDLNKLQPKALAAAMKGGTAGWGQVADARAMVRYSQPVRPASRRRCPCGCETRATHMGMANGLAMASGCAMAIARWVKTGFFRATKTPNVGGKAHPEGVSP